MKSRLPLRRAHGDPGPGAEIGGGKGDHQPAEGDHAESNEQIDCRAAEVCEHGGKRPARAGILPGAVILLPAAGAANLLSGRIVKPVEPALAAGSGRICFRVFTRPILNAPNSTDTPPRTRQKRPEEIFPGFFLADDDCLCRAAGDAEQFEDLTMLNVQYRGKNGGNGNA